MDKKIKVMVIDDSAVVRQTLSSILSSDPQIEVIDTASDPIIATEKLKKRAPDVITLDVEMPRMDGLTFLEKLMSQHPIPVVMCSSVAEKGSENAFRAMELGAVDIIVKPRLGAKQFLEESQVLICDAIKAAYLAKPKKFSSVAIKPKLSADVVLPPTRTVTRVTTTEKVVVVGASTGGTEALSQFLSVFPIDAPGILVVQHMPENFTTAFAKRLDALCQITVKEAQNNDALLRGQALIAPGHSHVLLKRAGARYYVEVKKGPLVNRHRPSVNVLFRSAARYAGSNAIGVIMTGMGDDGAMGLLEMKKAGATTIAQDEATSVVFGMPKEAIKLEAADHILPLEKIAGSVYQLCKA